MGNIAEIGTFLGSAAENYSVLQQQERDRQRLAAEFAELKRRNTVAEQMAKLGLRLEQSDTYRNWAQQDYENELFKNANQAKLDKEQDINQFVEQLHSGVSQSKTGYTPANLQLGASGTPTGTPGAVSTTTQTRPMTEEEFATGSVVRGMPKEQYGRLQDAYYPKDPEYKPPPSSAMVWTGDGYVDIRMPEGQQKATEYQKTQDEQKQKVKIDKWIKDRTNELMDNIYEWYPLTGNPLLTKEQKIAAMTPEEKFETATARAITEARQKFGDIGDYQTEDSEIPKDLPAPPVGRQQIVETKEEARAKLRAKGYTDEQIDGVLGK